jgi:hypothetical protein
MPGTDSIVGSGSLMPEDLYLRKYETSCVYESPSMINDYNRNELKKEGSQQPFFESDQKRTNYDTKGRLALRDCGKRKNTEPWLPDGTFLDHQFATKDPRSIMYGPDMRKHVDQQYARKNYYNFRNDNDYSIPEIGIHPEAYYKKIRETQQQAKERMNIFETSQVAWQTGIDGNLITKRKSLLNTVTDTEMSQVSDSTLENRVGKTNSLSNDTSIGWRRGVDHRFQVAHYGQQRGSRDIGDQDYYKNRGSTKYDQENDYVMIEESPVPRPTAEMIVDLSAKRLQEVEGASHVKLGKGKGCKVMKRRLTQADMIKCQSKYSKQSGKISAHIKLDGMQGNTPGVQFVSDDNLQRHTILKPTIVDKMTIGNKKRSEVERDDLRQSIKQSAKDGGIYLKEKNYKRMAMETLDPTCGRNNVKYNFKRGEEKKVHVYGASRGTKKGTDMSRVTTEDFGSQSYNTEQRRRNLSNAKNMQKTDTEESMEVREFTPHQIGKKGSMNKSKVKYMNVRDNAMQEMGISEMGASVRR